MVLDALETTRRVFVKPMRNLRTYRLFLLLLLHLLLVPGILLGEPPGVAESTEHSLVVTVTAFNSLPAQTDANPSTAAWGDRLEPGMKVVAVSADLLEMGLTKGMTLRIEGLEGDYVVLDKTASRHKKRVDVYMGTDVRKARKFGVRKLRIFWSD